MPRRSRAATPLSETLARITCDWQGLRDGCTMQFTMLKQKITDVISYPSLFALRSRLVACLGTIPDRLETIQLIDTTDFNGLSAFTPRYVFETDTHVTPPFALDGDSVEIPEPEEPTSVSQMTLDEAAVVLARELAEVA